MTIKIKTSLTKSNLVKTTMTLLCLFPFSSVNADINLKFIEGKKFTDYELTGQSRNKSLDTVEKDLNKLLTKLSSEALTEKQTLEVDVTNIDLPGMVRYGLGPRHQDLRVVESNRPYMLYFTYRLKDLNGKVIKKGEHQLKEYVDFSLTSRMSSHLGTMGYYKKPLKKWFNKTF
jgi:hypothetical protein